MATKKKAVKRKPLDEKMWAIATKAGRIKRGWFGDIDLYPRKVFARQDCYEDAGERVIRVRIVEVVK